MGCCLVAGLAFLGPRIVLVFMWLFTTYLNRPYPVFIVPVLGFFFLPWTTIAYAWAVDNRYGLSGWGLLWVIVALLVDVSTYGGGASSRRRYRA